MSNEQKHRQWDGSKFEVPWREHAQHATIAISSGKETAIALLFDEGGYRAHYEVATATIAAFIETATRAFRDHSKTGSVAIMWTVDMVASGISPKGPGGPPPGPPGKDWLPAHALLAHHQLLAFTEAAFELGRESVR